jgi:hypothetical protein
MVTSPARAGTSAVVAVLGAVGLLLVLVTWAASIGPDRVVSGGHLTPVRPTQPTASTVAPAKDPQQEARDRERGDPPSWVGVVAFAVELLTVAVVLFLLGRATRKARQWLVVRRRRRRPPPPEDVEFEVVGSAGRVSALITEDAEEQRNLLTVPGEPRNAIVECWHRFERQAVRAGVERRAWQTTSEFVLRVLDLVGADGGAVARLADLYREARFSDHPMTDEHRAAALDALDAIHRSLGGRLVKT